jgi:hypothetical protein
MSGFAGEGRLQDAEWLMRACIIMNRVLPPGAPPYTEETELNRVYTQQAAGFADLLERIDPEGEIDPAMFPVLAHFSAAESWPIDILIAAFAALGVMLFMPNYFGVGEYVAYLVILTYIAVQFLRTRRVRERARYEMRRLNLDPNQRHPLTLRMLVKYRRTNITVH